MKVFSKTWLSQLLRRQDKDSFSIFMSNIEEECSTLDLPVPVRPLSSRITSLLLIKTLPSTPPLTSTTILIPNHFKLLLNPKLTRELVRPLVHHQARLSSTSWMISTCHTSTSMEPSHQFASFDKSLTMDLFMIETILMRRRSCLTSCSQHA